MADPRHAPDTLFFVVEEDFRLFARHSQCQPEALARVAECAYAASSTAFHARTAVMSEKPNEPVALGLEEVYAWRTEQMPIVKTGRDLFGPPAMNTDSWKQLVGGLYTPRKKPTRAEIEEFGMSPYLEDLVRIVTAAARKEVGELVWLSYDAFDRRGFKQRVCHAATLIAVSALGAKKLHELLEQGALGSPGHFDIMLLKYLNHHGQEFGASYVFPCVGHYQAHLSGSSDNEGWRNAQWTQKWVQEGTRAAHAEKGVVRWLMGWVPKGNKWIREIHIPEQGDEDLRWFTRSGAPEGWHEEAAAANERKGKGKGKQKTKQAPRVIQPYWHQGATQMLDDPPLDTGRQKRTRRAQNRDYAFRIFVAEGQQVEKKQYAVSLSPGTTY